MDYNVLRAKNYEDQFLKVAEELGYPIIAHKMPPETAAAMWQDANVSITAQDIILRYLKNEFGARLVIPRRQVRNFGDNHIAPECSYYETPKQKKIHYWTKPIDKVVTTCVEKFLEEQKEVHEKKKIDIG